MLTAADFRIVRRHIVAVVAVLSLFFAGMGSPAAQDAAVVQSFFSGEAVTVEPPAGQPPAATIRAADGRVLGYAFSTRTVAGSVGYSGRPLDVIAAVAPDGVILGASLVAHEEPILVIGISPQALDAYVAGFRGFNVLGGTIRAGAAGAPHAIAGATVTSSVIRDAIVRAGRAVLRARVSTPDRPRLDRESLGRLSWPRLVEQGAAKELRLSRGEAARLLGTQDAEPDKPFIDLWMVLATPPAIGESLLGQRIYESELAKLGPEDDLLIVGATGLYSFRGTDWRRSGVFDRIELVQGTTTIRLRATDHTLVESLRAAGAPELREISLFRIARATGFDPTAPFRLDLVLRRADGGQSPSPPPIVSLDYQIPDVYVRRPPSVAPTPPQPTPTTQQPAPAQQPGAAPPAAEAPPAPRDTSVPTISFAEPANGAPLWQQIWWARRYELAVLVVMLGALGGILVFQTALTRRTRLYRVVRISYLTMTLVFLGYIASAQLSVVNVLTFVQALLTGFRWELFLLDPLVFTLWSFVAVSLLFWGRGVFCGWLCPFGALQELSNGIAQRLGVKQIELPFGLHERLWMIKYVVFLGLLAISLNSVTTAFRFAEIEPFKTAITLKFVREWPFVAYAGALLFIGLFIPRFFCRYLCPLGGALAIPARMRMFEWLKRYRECGNECHICERTCPVQSIHPLGQINPNECIYCLRCQANYYDESLCWHLKKRAERRRPRAVAAAAKPSEGGAQGQRSAEGAAHAP